MSETPSDVEKPTGTNIKKPDFAAHREQQPPVSPHQDHAVLRAKFRAPTARRKRGKAELVSPDFAGHAAQCKQTAPAGELVQGKFVQAADQVLDGRVTLALFGTNEWQNMDGPYVRQSIDFKSLGVPFAALEKSVARVFTKIGIDKQAMEIQPSSARMAHVYLTRDVYTDSQKLFAMTQAHENAADLSLHYR